MSSMTNGNHCVICGEGCGEGESPYNETSDVAEVCKNRHCFHTGCILEWTKRNDTCPVCRESVFMGMLSLPMKIQRLASLIYELMVQDDDITLRKSLNEMYRDLFALVPHSESPFYLIDLNEHSSKDGRVCPRTNGMEIRDLLRIVLMFCMQFRRTKVIRFFFETAHFPCVQVYKPLFLTLFPQDSLMASFYCFINESRGFGLWNVLSDHFAWMQHVQLPDMDCSYMHTLVSNLSLWSQEFSVESVCRMTVGRIITTTILILSENDDDGTIRRFADYLGKMMQNASTSMDAQDYDAHMQTMFHILKLHLLYTAIYQLSGANLQRILSGEVELQFLNRRTGFLLVYISDAAKCSKHITLSFRDDLVQHMSSLDFYHNMIDPNIQIVNKGNLLASYRNLQEFTYWLHPHHVERDHDR